MCEPGPNPWLSRIKSLVVQRGSFVKVQENLKERASGNLTAMNEKRLEIFTEILTIGNL